MKPPTHYLNTPVPDPIRREWDTWTGLEWRLQQHCNRGELYPPDQRFSIKPPADLCSRHRQHWAEWRARHFRGIRFPGPPAGDGFYTRTWPSVDAAWEFCRAEWDEETRKQMQTIERICRKSCGAERTEEAA